MNHQAIEIVKYSSEGPNVDFKKEQYPIHNHPKKHELLKDFMAMVNHPSTEDKYIIIGVKEKNGIAHDFHNITDLIDESKYQQYINSNIEPKINFEYISFEYQNNQLSYFRLFDNEDRPYLIKKNVQNSNDKSKLEFKEGDGFIRVGPSTKKLTRKEFDDIYKKKFTIRDRKSDIDIVPKVGNVEREEFDELKLKYFDIDIINNSNKSIELDIELTINFNEKRNLVSETTFNRKLNEFKKPKTNYLGLSIPDMSGLIAPSLNLNIEDRDNSLFAERLSLRGEKCAVIIPQKSTEKDVFLKEIYIVNESDDLIKGELIIRSDDFTEGYLKTSIDYTIKE